MIEVLLICFFVVYLVFSVAGGAIEFLSDARKIRKALDK